MEQDEWKVQTNNDVEVEVTIKPQFIPNSTNKKPFEFIVDYTYGGIPAPTSPKTISNN